MGTAQFAVPSLVKLLELDQKIINIYSSPSKKANRGMRFSKSPVTEFAMRNGYQFLKNNLYQPESLDNYKQIRRIEILDPDIIIVIAYGLIIPKEILSIPKLGCFNLHGSLLPRWRGAAPIQRAMIEGDTKTGITFMKMDEGLDTGDIVLSKEISVNVNDNYKNLEEKLSNLGADSFSEFFNLIENKKDFVRQNNDLSTYAKKN